MVKKIYSSPAMYADKSSLRASILAGSNGGLKDNNVINGVNRGVVSAQDFDFESKQHPSLD